MSKKIRRLDRRGFFGQLLGNRFRPEAPQNVSAPGMFDMENRPLLRPPGALPEHDLLQVCLHSGKCVDHCPANAIQTYLGDREELVGTPFIDPDQQPCVVCDSLACMHVCPSGALQVQEREQIRMGIAIWSFDECLRTSAQACRECVDRCPLGNMAIRLDGNGRIEIQPGCVGCGVCQQVCPTNAIQVAPGSVVQELRG